MSGKSTKQNRKFKQRWLCVSCYKCTDTRPLLRRLPLYNTEITHKTNQSSSWLGRSDNQRSAEHGVKCDLSQRLKVTVETVNFRNLERKFQTHGSATDTASSQIWSSYLVHTGDVDNTIMICKMVSHSKKYLACHLDLY